MRGIAVGSTSCSSQADQKNTILTKYLMFSVVLVLVLVGV
jgi:hypothetical protein